MLDDVLGSLMSSRTCTTGLLERLTTYLTLKAREWPPNRYDW